MLLLVFISSEFLLHTPHIGIKLLHPLGHHRSPCGSRFQFDPGILQTIADRCQRAVVCGRLFLQIIQQLFALCVFGFQSR